MRLGEQLRWIIYSNQEFTYVNAWWGWMAGLFDSGKIETQFLALVVNVQVLSSLQNSWPIVCECMMQLQDHRQRHVQSFKFLCWILIWCSTLAMNSACHRVFLIPRSNTSILLRPKLVNKCYGLLASEICFCIKQNLCE